MDMMEIILLIAGGMVFILSFFIPDRKTAAVNVKELTEEERQKLIQDELLSIRALAEDLAERTERSLEKISNEKIMAVDEYSATVLAEIHKNHEEAMFLYDMLNNKHVSLKNTLSEVGRTAKEAEKTIAAMRDMMSRASVDESGKEQADPIKKQKAEDDMPDKSAAALEMQQELDKEELAAILETGASGHSNNEKILALYRQGKSAVVIAKELGLGTGEVKLVIDLFQNTQASM